MRTLTQFFTSLVDSTFSLLCSFPPALCLSFSLCLWMVSGPSLHPATVEQIVSVFQAASKQKAWDHFSKAQRKNLDMWRKQAEVSTLPLHSVVHVISGKRRFDPICLMPAPPIPHPFTHCFLGFFFYHS